MDKKKERLISLNTLSGWACRKHQSIYYKTACGNQKRGTLIVVGNGF